MRGTFFHRFVLTDGGVIVVPLHRAQRTLDRKGDHGPVEVVWEVELDSGVIRRLWPSDIREWMEENADAK